jgi:hypothetical protein
VSACTPSVTLQTPEVDQNTKRSQVVEASRASSKQATPDGSTEGATDAQHTLLAAPGVRMKVGKGEKQSAARRDAMKMVAGKAVRGKAAATQEIEEHLTRFRSTLYGYMKSVCTRCRILFCALLFSICKDAREVRLMCLPSSCVFA